MNGSVVEVEKTFKGTEQEVEDAVDAFLNENSIKLVLQNTYKKSRIAGFFWFIK